MAGEKLLQKALGVLVKSAPTKVVEDPAERAANLAKAMSRSAIKNTETNEPIRLYHATRQPNLEALKAGGHDPELSGPATWLSPYADKQPAFHNTGGGSNYREGANVMPVYADIQTPLVLDTPEMIDWAQTAFAGGSREFPQYLHPDWRKALIDEGYDGIVYGGPKSKEYALHDLQIGQQPHRDEEILSLFPERQLKSAIGNGGEFNMEIPRLSEAHGGQIDAALHAVRQHRDSGGFLSGPDYLSTGEVASPTNWGDPELASDFFKADKALRLAREVQANADDVTGSVPAPLPLRRPAPEAAPRPTVAAPPPAPAPEPAPVNIPYVAPTQMMRMTGENTSPLHLTERPGFGQSLTESDPSRANPSLVRADTTPEINSRGLQTYTLPEAALARPGQQAQIDRAVSLAQNLAPAQPEAIPSAADALAAVEKLHNAGVYSGEELDKAGEILQAHNRAKLDNIPVEEALRLIRAEGPRMVNQGMPREERPSVRPMAYAATPAPAPAVNAIDQATGKLTARIPDEPSGIPLTRRQADLITRTIAAETSGRTPEEGEAIANVILNRIRSGQYGDSPEAVLFAKRQFEPWMNPAGANYPLKISPTGQRYLDAQANLEAALAGEDITRGATNFWGPKSQYSLGRDTPDWAVRMPDYTDIGATRFHRPNTPIQTAQAQTPQVPSTGVFAFGTNDPNPQTALKSAQQIYENARRAGIDPVFVLPNSADPRFAPISEALKKYADDRGIKYEMPSYDPKDPLHITPDTAKEIAKKYPGALVGGDSNSWRLQKYGYGRPVSSPNAFVDSGTGLKLGQVGAGSPDVSKWFGQYVDRLSRGRAHGGEVDDALRVVREHHADGEAVGQMSEAEPRPLTIYRDNRPVAENVAPPTFSYMPTPESVARQATRQPAYDPAERTWSNAGSTEGERLTRALGVEGGLPTGQTYMSAAPTGWDKYMPQRRPGSYMKRWGEAFNENADAIEEGLKAVREGNYGAGALGVLGGGMGVAMSPLTGLERVLVRDPYLQITGNLKDAQAAEMAADAALTGGVRGMVTPFAKAGSLERMATEPWNKVRMPAPAVVGAGVTANALTPDEAEASKLSKAMDVARMAIPRELSPLGLYSHGAEVARGLAQAKGTPQQFASMLEKAGVKGPEMESYLQTFGGRPIVTKEEIAQHFRESMPMVEERVLGTPSPEQMKGLRDEYARAEYGEDFSGLASEYKRRIDDLIMDRRSTTKFGKYTLPGGENYREVLLKHPEKEAPYFPDFESYFKSQYSPTNPTAEAIYRQGAIRNWNAAEGKIPNYKGAENYHSSHWDDPNVLAHLRMSDRTGPNGEKILHVEEVQSDWGQEGKKEGFQKLVPPELQSAADKIIEDKIQPQAKLMPRLVDPNTKKISAHNIPEDYINLWKENGIVTPEEAQTLMDLRAAHDARWSGLPSAPYVTSTQGWTDLALKRALKEAAEGGYDKLVWTPGAEQAKRYDLSQHVNNITWSAEPDGKYWVGATGKDGRPVRGLDNEPMTPKQLEETFGKEIAEKIVKGEGQKIPGGPELELTGLDLQTGGEGMKAYYDKILPKRLQELIKKHDPSAKVGYTDVMLPPQSGMGHNNPPIEAPGITITPAMRESILRGQAAHASGGSVVDRALMLTSKQA